MKLERKIFQKEVSADIIEKLPTRIKKTMEILDEEESLAIKGGIARMALHQALNIPNRIAGKDKDVDIVLNYFGTMKKNINPLCERVDELTKKLNSIITLKGENVEPFRGNDIRKFLETRDFTINEALLVPRNEKWVLYYTHLCHEHLKKSIGYLSANGKGTMRFHAGRLIAGPKGIARLLEFLVEGKVKQIYLPKWWIRVNKSEMKRVNKPDLGAYGIFLCRRYKNPKLQNKLMRVLKSLGITKLSSFEEYAREQVNSFNFLNRNEFTIKSRSFREVLEALKKTREKGEEMRKKIREEREKCEHKFEKSICSRCKKECEIIKCKRCTKIEITPAGWSRPARLDQLLCNYNFVKGYLNPFFLFPPRPRRTPKTPTKIKIKR